MAKHGFWHNILPEIALTYQFAYMWGEKCKIDQTMNDVYRYCWNNGCKFEEMWGNTS